MSPGVAKKQLSVESPSASRPSFESAPQKSFEKSGARRSSRDRHNAQFFTGDTNNNLIVYMYRLLAFDI